MTPAARHTRTELRPRRCRFVEPERRFDLAAGMVQVDAGLSKFSGVVQCDTLISNAVVSSSYTPGAGNIW